MADWKTEDLTLTHPIKIGEEVVTVLHFREPDLETLERIDEATGGGTGRASVKQTKMVMAILCGRQPDDLNGLHRDDYMAIADLVAPLLAGPGKPAP